MAVTQIDRVIRVDAIVSSAVVVEIIITPLIGLIKVIDTHVIIINADAMMGHDMGVEYSRSRDRTGAIIISIC